MTTVTIPERIHVLDMADTPVAVLSADQIHAQQLRHRGFLLLVRDRRKRLLMRRLPHNHPVHPGCLDVVGKGHVGWDQAAEEAAEHALPPAARDSESSLRHVTRQERGGTGQEIVDVFEVILSDQAALSLEQEHDYLFADIDEWTALACTFSDQLTPALRTVWESEPWHPLCSMKKGIGTM